MQGLEEIDVVEVEEAIATSELTLKAQVVAHSKE
jgi:hypothetical protein